MSDNKPKVPATGMLEISISGGENLQGHLVGQLVFDKDNPFTAEILQVTSAPAVIKIKDSSQQAVKKESETQEPEAQEFEDENEGEIIYPYSEQYSSPRTSVLTTQTNKSNNDEPCGFRYVKKGLKSSPFQALSYPSGTVHCNSCPECLRGGCDNKEEYFPTVTTSGPESACIWPYLERKITPSVKKERMAAGGTSHDENNSRFNESYSSSCTPTQPDYKETTNNFSPYIQARPMYQDSTHNIVFSEEARVSQRPVTPIRQNYQPNNERRSSAGGGGMTCCARQYCCNNGRVNLGDHSSNICSLVKDLNCRTHNARSALCCSVAENVHYARDNAYQQLCIVDNCEQHNVNQMERLLLEQRTTVPCCGQPITDEVFSQNLRQQCIDQTPSGCGEVRESDDVSFRRRSLPLGCVPCVTDCSPSKILRFASGRDDMAGEEMYSQHTKHHSLGRCCTGECYERRECEERDLMRRSGCPGGLPCPIKCVQPCDTCPPPAGNPALECQQPTEYSGNWDCRFNSEEIFGHHKQLYNVDQGYCNYNEVNDDQKEYKRTSRPLDYVCLQQCLCHLQALDQCAGRTCGGKDYGDAECFQHSKTRNMSRSPCGNRQLNESEARHDRRLYGTPVNNFCRPQPQTENHILAGKNPTLTQGNLEYTDHSKAGNVNTSLGGQIDLTESECCKEEIQQVPPCKLAAGDDRNHSCSPCGGSSEINDDYNQLAHTRSIDRIPERTSDLLEPEQKEDSQNIPVGGGTCPVAIPDQFGGPVPIPRDIDILITSQMHYPNIEIQNGEFVTSRLPGISYPPSTVSDKVVSPSCNQGNEDYLQQSVVCSIDKNGGAAVDVEKEQMDSVHFVTPRCDERQFQQQLNKNRLRAAGCAESPNLKAKSLNSCQTVNEIDDFTKSRLTDPKKEYNHLSNRYTVDENDRENFSSEYNFSQKIDPRQRQTAGANSIQSTDRSHLVKIPALGENDLLNVSQKMGVSGEDSISQLSGEELEELQAEEYMQHSRTHTVDKEPSGALDIIEQVDVNNVEQVPKYETYSNIPTENDQSQKTKYTEDNHQSPTSQSYIQSTESVSPACNRSAFEKAYIQQSLPKMPMSSKQAINSMQSNTPSTTFSPINSYERIYERLPEMNGPCYGDRAHFQYNTPAAYSYPYNTPAYSYPAYGPQAGWDRSFPTAMIAGGDLRFTDKYLPNDNSHEAIQDKHPINDYNSKTNVPSYYGMQQEYFPNKMLPNEYDGANIAAQRQRRI